MTNSSRHVFDEATRDDCLNLIALALGEDLGGRGKWQSLDCTTESVVPGNVRGAASFVSRQQGVVCGLAVAELIVQQIDRDLDLEIFRPDGSLVEPRDVIATFSGNANDILITERTCLNFMGRLSGISTQTAKYVQQVEGTRAKVLDTRKTTPGWRRLEKYAVACGGGHNHRMGLYDAILIKDNHLAMMSSLANEKLDEIETALTSARDWIAENADRLPHGNETVIQIEVDRLDQFREAIRYEPDIVLLDNMTNGQLREAVQIRSELGSQVLLEASGGVNLQTIASIAKTGVDRISVGALTHSAVNFDIGLDWKLE